jgi:hypothetical protein
MNPAEVTRSQVLALERPFLGQRAVDHRDGLIGRVQPEAMLFEPARDPGLLGRSRQGEQPRHVVRAHQMDRAPVDPRHDDRALVDLPVDVGDRQAGHAGAQRQHPGAEILRLDREQPLRNRLRAARGRAGEQLGTRAQRAQVCRLQTATSSSRATSSA